MAAAADPTAYPELAREGLRPWRVLRLYIGGTRQDEPWQVRVETGEYNPVLGDSYVNLARRGLALQRSQTSGRFVPVEGPAPLYYTLSGGGPRTETFFDGLPTALPDLYRLLGRDAPPGAEDCLAAIATEVSRARANFDWTDPSAVATSLARGLALTRQAVEAAGDDDVRFALQVKERQFEDALGAALGLALSATAEPAGTTPATGPGAQDRAPATLGAVTPGSRSTSRLAFTSHGRRTVTLDRLDLDRCGRHCRRSPGRPDAGGIE